jgi:hypothetical protein
MSYSVLSSTGCQTPSSGQTLTVDALHHILRTYRVTMSGIGQPTGRLDSVRYAVWLTVRALKVEWIWLRKEPACQAPLHGRHGTARHERTGERGCGGRIRPWSRRTYVKNASGATETRKAPEAVSRKTHIA